LHKTKLSDIDLPEILNIMNYPSLGEKLKNFRKLKDVSQSELEIGIDAAGGSISRMEKGYTNPTKETLLKIAEFLKLSTIELEYLNGLYSQAATEEEIERLRNKVADYMKRKDVFAYIVDDRSRMVDLSQGFIKLGNITHEQKEKLIGEYMPKIISDESLAVRKFISDEDFEDTMKYAFARTYHEMHFMIGDPHYENILKIIRANPIISKIWNSYTNNPPEQIPPHESRKVTFVVNGMKLPLVYFAETLMGFNRFQILDYKPTNLLHKILSKII
jgi:transcriptional regulator with XRE-family HTH domain